MTGVIALRVAGTCSIRSWCRSCTSPQRISSSHYSGSLGGTHLDSACASLRSCSQRLGACCSSVNFCNSGVPKPYRRVGTKIMASQYSRSPGRWCGQMTTFVAIPLNPWQASMTAGRRCCGTVKSYSVSPELVCSSRTVTVSIQVLKSPRRKGRLHHKWARNLCSIFRRVPQGKVATPRRL